jgi:dolichol-phosphate mannosyltransferase
LPPEGELLQDVDDGASEASRWDRDARYPTGADSREDSLLERARTLRTLTILLPALNEAAAIGQVLDELPMEMLQSMGYVPRVVIVDGHSTDATAAIARSHGVDVLPQIGTGKGWAVRTGLAAARTDYLVMLDADYTYPAGKIPELLSHLDRGADVVIGSRIDGAIEEGAMRPLNVLGNRFLSFLASTLYGQRTSDVCSGMWAFGPRAKDVLSLNSRGFELEAEMFAQAVKNGLRVKEVPIAYRRRVGEQKLANFSDGLSIAAKLVRKRFVR